MFVSYSSSFFQIFLWWFRPASISTSLGNSFDHFDKDDEEWGWVCFRTTNGKQGLGVTRRKRGRGAGNGQARGWEKMWKCVFTKLLFSSVVLISSPISGLYSIMGVPCLEFLHVKIGNWGWVHFKVVRNEATTILPSIHNNFYMSVILTQCRIPTWNGRWERVL